MTNKQEWLEEFEVKLKLCPFCAAAPKMYKIREGLWTVVCKCGAESPKDSKSKAGAKRIWERRRLAQQQYTKGLTEGEAKGREDMLRECVEELKGIHERKKKDLGNQEWSQLGGGSIGLNMNGAITVSAIQGCLFALKSLSSRATEVFDFAITEVHNHDCREEQCEEYKKFLSSKTTTERIKEDFGDVLTKLSKE